MKVHSCASLMHRHSELPSRPEHCRLFKGDSPRPVPVCWEGHGGRRHQAEGGEPLAMMPASKGRSVASGNLPQGTALPTHHVLHYSWCSRDIMGAPWL